jgi:S1-C subfamily serine protease
MNGHHQISPSASSVAASEPQALSVEAHEPSSEPQPAPGPVPTDVPETEKQAAASTADPATPALEDVITRVMPAVVTIQTLSSRGSGFFVAPDTVITNVHVVGTDSTVTLRRPNGTTTTARVQATSPAFDIAVLKVSGAIATQPTIQLGSTAGVRVGEEVIAIGTPLGFLQNTVSRGIVSGLRDVGGATLVQTDAAINPGNSGGPLLNRNGDVIGIIKSGYVGSDGLAFAVAVDHARALIEGRADPPAASTAPTQYQALSPAVASPEDQRRLDATRSYEEAVAQLARHAEMLDERWKSFTAQCYQGRIAGTFDRPWFALWDSRAMQGNVASNCSAYFEDFRRQANEVQQAVAALDEAARRADVYPGTRRDVLRKNRLDYAGWNK